MGRAVREEIVDDETENGENEDEKGPGDLV
jgi:hypothetical protein